MSKKDKKKDDKYPGTRVVVKKNGKTWAFTDDAISRAARHDAEADTGGRCTCTKCIPRGYE